MRGRAAVAGIGESDSWDVAGAGLTALDLIGQATAAALDDAGLRRDDVDGLFTASAYHGMPGLDAGEALGSGPATATQRTSAAPRFSATCCTPRRRSQPACARSR